MCATLFGIASRASRIAPLSTGTFTACASSRSETASVAVAPPTTASASPQTAISCATAIYQHHRPEMGLAASPLLFFINDTATTEIYTLSLHDALPIYRSRSGCRPGGPAGRDRRPRAPVRDR